jgi:hypothetical protein
MNFFAPIGSSNVSRAGDADCGYGWLRYAYRLYPSDDGKQAMLDNVAEQGNGNGWAAVALPPGMPEYQPDQVAKSPLTMPDRSRKTLHLPAKPAAEPAAKPAEQAAPAKPRISPDEQRAREAADQEAKRIRIAALSKDAEVLKATLIERYPHLFAAEALKPLASGIHRVLA